jgi:spermidine dehydrogenase
MTDKTRDRDLGMDRPIDRRDFLNGVALSIGATLVAGKGLAAESAAGDASSQEPFLAQGITPQDSRYYPPRLTGMRGSHPGSFETAHAKRDGENWQGAEDTGERYDVVVVGAGMSGLAAAYFFRKAMPGIRVLILDNHDDFGGHAKRNEFRHGDRLLIGYGGTMEIEAPGSYTLEGKTLLHDIGIQDTQALVENEKLYASLGLKPGVFFDKETFGADRLVVGEFDRKPSPEFLAKAPLSEQAKRDLARLSAEKRDYLAGMTNQQKIERLRKISYRDYLLSVVKVQPQVAAYFQTHMHGWSASGGGADSTSAWAACRMGFMPGFAGLGLEIPPESWVPDPGRNLHFPDGNAGVARLLVRWLIPSALPGTSMEDSVTTPVNYTALDEAANDVRIRLNSTVVRALHKGEIGRAREVEITYARSGKAYRVLAGTCVMACNNSMIPYLCPELPGKQKDALHMAVRLPIVYTNVLLRDWKAFQKLGIHRVESPGGFYHTFELDFPISVGTYRCPRTPDEPILVHMERTVLKPGQGLTARDQARAGRAELLATTFPTFERETREQLARTLVGSGFDPARDIEAITVNRWPHGYAAGENSLFDPDWSDEELPWIVGRKRFGRIAIANSDSAAICLTQAAIEQAHRAVQELLTDVIRRQFRFPYTEKV